MEDKIYGNVYVTKGYDKFISLEQNRPIANGIVLKSIQEFNMLPEKPILVTKNLEVLDGQHRLSAARILGVEIYYTIARDEVSERELGKLNTQVNWTLVNFLKLYAKDDENYQIMERLLERCGRPQLISFLINIFGPTKRHPEGDFKGGKYKINATEDECMEVLDKLMELKEVIEFNVKPFGIVTAKTLYALNNIIHSETYNHDIAVRKFSLGMVKDRLKDAIAWSGIPNMEAALREVYNFKTLDASQKI